VSTTPSNAIWTIPNALTFLRLGLLPFFLIFALASPPLLGWTVVIGAIGLITDLADGAIARRTGTITKLGMRLDPLADRLSLAAGIIVILVHSLAWPWLVWIVAARDAALVIVGVVALKITGREIPPVSNLGKRASFMVSIGLGLTIIAGAVGSASAPNEAIRIVAYCVLIPGVALYLVAGAGYVRAALKPQG
jgi:cardiolipin synthase (CMP-forming)